MTIRENGDYIKVLVYSYDTTMTGWGVHLMSAVLSFMVANDARVSPPTGPS